MGKIRNKEQRMMKETKRKEELELAALYKSHIYIYIIYIDLYESQTVDSISQMCAVT